MSNNNYNKNRNNYNKMYDAGKRAETNPVDEVVPVEIKPEVEKVINDVVDMDAAPVKMEKPVKPKAVTGKVTCEFLNVRVAPNREATIMIVISKGDEVTIDMKESTDEWYKIITKDDASGYCMKKFIAR